MCKPEDYKVIDDCEHEKIYSISQKQYDHAQKVWYETSCKKKRIWMNIYETLL